MRIIVHISNDNGDDVHQRIDLKGYSRFSCWAIFLMIRGLFSWSTPIDEEEVK